MWFLFSDANFLTSILSTMVPKGHESGTCDLVSQLMDALKGQKGLFSPSHFLSFFPCLLPSSIPSFLFPPFSCPPLFFGLDTLNARGSAGSSTFSLHQAMAPGLRKFRGGKAKSACAPRSSCVWTWNWAQNSSCLLTYAHPCQPQL